MNAQVMTEQGAGGGKPVALVVEDDEQIARLIGFILQREGYTVETATDGAIAIRKIGAMTVPAIVTLDVMIPVIDGFGVLKAMRENADWKQVPVLMLSAKSQEHDVTRAVDAGATAYLIKPFKPEELRARVRQLTGTGS